MSNKPVSKEERLIRLLARIERLLKSADRWSDRTSNVRLMLFAAGGISTFFVLSGESSGWANRLVGLFTVLFTVTVVYHSRLKGRIRRIEHWRAIKETHLARLRLDWRSIPPIPPGPPDREAAVSEHHPYADDLDILGPYSLLRLLDTTVSTRGHACLAAALLQPEFVSANAECRQALVQELVTRSLLRDKIILEARTISQEGLLRTEEMLEALKRSQVFAGIKRVFILEAALAALTALFFVLEQAFDGPRVWPSLLVTYIVIYLFYAGRLAPIFGRALTLRSGLERLKHLLCYLEKRRDTDAPKLHALCAPFRQAGLRPSQLLRKMARVCDGLSVKANPLVHLALNLLFPWDIYFSLKYEHLRTRLLAVFPLWMDALGQIEMASSLAQFSASHPEYAFPQMDPESQGSPTLVAEEVGHPLLPPSKRVVNDFTLSGLGSITLITGSNMSGKSTFLRTLGINVCLAQAGGPVCARSFSAPRMRIFCSLRIKDDLEMGLSYFYAEVKRLKQILDAAADTTAPPVLFLIDEIFKGTNNQERIIGSTAYLKALVKSHGLGLVTTHDLELTGLAAENRKISNAYFKESVGGGLLVFDYRLHKGLCSETNALRIMAMEGLPIE